MSQELEENEFFRFYEVLEDEKRRIRSSLKEKLYAKNEIIMAYLYGSILKSNVIRDIDVAVYVTEVKNYLDYKFKLEEELSNQLGYPVDVKILNEAPFWFTLEVCSEGELLFSRIPCFSTKICKKALEELEGLRLKNKYF